MFNVKSQLYRRLSSDSQMLPEAPIGKSNLRDFAIAGEILENGTLRLK